MTVYEVTLAYGLDTGPFRWEETCGVIKLDYLFDIFVVEKREKAGSCWYGDGCWFLYLCCCVVIVSLFLCALKNSWGLGKFASCFVFVWCIVLFVMLLCFVCCVVCDVVVFCVLCCVVLCLLGA